MRQWTIARTFTSCGSCRRTIQANEPLQEIALVGIPGKRYRCVGCADGPVNEAELDLARLQMEREAAELAELHGPGRAAERIGLTRSFTPVSAFEQPDFFDAKTKAAGDE